MKINSLITTTANDLLSLLYPRVCICCDTLLMTQESEICFDCIVDLPRTNFHNERNNPIEKLFWGRVNIERATSFIQFQKGGIFQKMVHTIKYNDNYNAGVVMGRIFASEIYSSNFFDGIDIIVPVPLHPKKERKRGYNQSHAIAEGMSQIIKIPIDNSSLCRKTYTDSQTHKSRWDRWINVESRFALSEKQNFEGKHILLVDDVITTGATIEACASVISTITNVKISLATLGCAMV